MTYSKILDFPNTKVSACVVRECDDDLIFLNARCGSEKNRRSYDHELKHIEEDDLRREEEATLIEARAHEA